MQATEGDHGLSTLHSLVLGLVEGLTEFLPVSSTGHLIVANAFFGTSDPAFEVAIQAGAITAILVLYWRPLLRSLAALWQKRAAADAAGSGGTNLLVAIFIAAVPAAGIGLCLDDLIESYLFDPLVVAATLILGGLGFFWVEAWSDRRTNAGHTPTTMADLTPRQALVIGFWQTLALIPGTSRSGATIVGGLVTGLSRAAAAEFSFLVGLPILYGACVLKLASDFERFTGPMLPSVLVASAASFVTALLIVGPFVRFLQRHTFRPFAWYRIAAGVAIVALWGAGIIRVDAPAAG
ncbi:MAG: undecaprenyl-diphosphate phosphatase [Planctomycetota bacterium]